MYTKLTTPTNQVNSVENQLKINSVHTNNIC